MIREWRDAGSADAYPMALLHKECFAAEAWSLEQIEGSLALATTRARLVEEAGKLMAFSLVQKTGEEAEILTLCVSPSARRQGLGFLLMQDILQAQKAGKVFLEVAADNRAAIALYERCGFQLLGSRTGYYVRSNEKMDGLTYAYLVNAQTL